MQISLMSITLSFYTCLNIFIYWKAIKMMQCAYLALVQMWMWINFFGENFIIARSHFTIEWNSEIINYKLIHPSFDRLPI